MGTSQPPVLSHSSQPQTPDVVQAVSNVTPNSFGRNAVPSECGSAIIATPKFIFLQLRFLILDLSIERRMAVEVELTAFDCRQIGRRCVMTQDSANLARQPLFQWTNCAF